jgi:hypothetical protein
MEVQEGSITLVYPLRRLVSKQDTPAAEDGYSGLC